MRKAYLVCYDISDPKRLRKMHEKMLGFGDPLQLSVFLCELSEPERVVLREAVLDIINLREDRVMIVDLGHRDTHRSRIEFIGKPVDVHERTVAIV